MKFSVGDKIKLRETGEEGVVVDIVQNQYLRVRINGLVIPAEEADLDFPYLDWFIKDREQKKELEKKRLKGKTVYIDNIKKDNSEHSAESQFEKGLYLLFQPVYREQDGEDIIHRFALYVFSEWAHRLNYLVDISIQGKSIFSFEGELGFQQKQLLYSFTFEDATNNPLFNFEINELDKKITPTHFFSQKLNRKKLIDKVTFLEKNNLPLFEIPVFTKLNPVKKMDLPQITNVSNSLTPLGTKASKRKSKGEIDLHIEKIYKQHHSLNDGEKLQFQLNYFCTYLDLAIADDNINPFRVIHGIGFGILKKEIFSICNQTIEVQDYVYDKVNPGVTLVYFKP
jgi:hypothetical protein